MKLPFDFKCWKQQLTDSIFAEYWLHPYLMGNRDTSKSVSLWLFHSESCPFAPLWQPPRIADSKVGLFLCFISQTIIWGYFIHSGPFKAFIEIQRHQLTLLTIIMIRYHHESKSDGYMDYISFFAKGKNGNHYQWVTHSVEGIWRNEAKDWTFYFYSVMALREIPGILHIYCMMLSIEILLSLKLDSLFLSDTNVHVVPCTPKGDKLAVNFTIHVTSKAKEIMILG